MAQRNDQITKNVVISLLTFLFVEALLPDEFKTVRHFYLVVQLIVLFILTIENLGQVTVASSSHVLLTYIALTIAYMELDSPK